MHSLTIIIAYLVLLSHFTTENARAELGRLFNFTPAGIPRKRKLPTGIKLPNTWTHTFVCLGRMSDNEVPSTGYKSQLSSGSLGEKKITFEKKSLCGYFHEKLLESYPRLKEGGGYELMRTKFRSTSKLEILQPKGNGGHNVLDLKEMVSSAKIYVRPLQKDLSLEQTEQPSLVSSLLIITSFLYHNMLTNMLLLIH